MGKKSNGFPTVIQLISPRQLRPLITDHLLCIDRIIQIRDLTLLTVFGDLTRRLTLNSITRHSYKLIDTED